MVIHYAMCIFIGGEVQEAEVHLPIISQKYSIDLSRTRSHFLPGFSLDVVVLYAGNKQSNAHLCV